MGDYGLTTRTSFMELVRKSFAVTVHKDKPIYKKTNLPPLKEIKFTYH